MGCRKGLVLWTYMIIFLTLVAIYFYVSNVIGAFSESARTSAALHSDKMAGVINVLQASPSVTCNTYFLPKMKCKIRIDSMRVNFTDEVNKISDITYYLQAPASVKLGSSKLIEISCDPSREKVLHMARCSNEIIISDDFIACGTASC